MVFLKLHKSCSPAELTGALQLPFCLSGEEACCILHLAVALGISNSLNFLTPKVRSWLENSTEGTFTRPWYNSMDVTFCLSLLLCQHRYYLLQAFKMTHSEINQSPTFFFKEAVAASSCEEKTNKPKNRHKEAWKQQWVTNKNARRRHLQKQQRTQSRDSTYCYHCWWQMFFKKTKISHVLQHDVSVSVLDIDL